MQVAEFKEKIAKAQLERTTSDIPPPVVALPTSLGGTVPATVPAALPATVPATLPFLPPTSVATVTAPPPAALVHLLSSFTF